MKRHIRMLAIAFCVGLVLSGCAAIPRSGSVHQGQAVSGDSDGLGPVDYLPSGPTRGASPTQILRGFIDAAVSPQDSYAVAREFLTPDFASTWNPDASVTIDTGSSRNFTEVNSHRVDFSVVPGAFVDDGGNYRVTDSSAPVVQSFTFEKARGQWRIAKAPDGTVIDQRRFTDVFSPHTLYFFSPDYRYLVPDERWFPSRPNIQTRIVKAIITGGPAPWLAGAVTSAFPQGTKLTVDSAPVSLGQVEVDLNSAASGVSQLTLQRMKVQLMRSLNNVASISRVEITVNGVERTTVDSGAANPIQDPAVDANPLVLKGGKFGFLSTDTVSPIAGISPTVAELKPQAVTLSADRTAAAVLSDGGVYAVRSGKGKLLVDSRAGLIAPSLDNSGYVWSVPRDSPNALRVTGPNGEGMAVKVAWPNASSILSIAVSRDNTRVIALVRTGKRDHIMAAGIIRTVDNLPQKINEPVDFGVLKGNDARSLTWLDELTVGLLMTNSDSDPVISTQILGGLSAQVDAPLAGQVLVGGNGVPPYWVLTSKRSLQAPRGTSWQARSGDISLVATQLGRPTT